MPIIQHSKPLPTTASALRPLDVFETPDHRERIVSSVDARRIDGENVVIIRHVDPDTLRDHDELAVPRRFVLAWTGRFDLG